MSDPAIVAARLKIVRLAYLAVTDQPGLDIEGYARMLGVSPDRYAAYERGVLEVPERVLAEVSRRTGIALDYLLGTWA